MQTAKYVGRLEYVDRSKKENWLRYMEKNPVYFEFVYHMAYDKSILEQVWERIKDERLMFLT